MRTVAIIGGGASGLAAAIQAKRKNPVCDVVIVERLERVGKKILATGNGHCNYTNTDIQPKYYHGTDGDFIASVLSDFGTAEAVSFLKSVGVEPHIDTSGRVYPYSRSASAVVDALRFECAAQGVRIESPFRVAGLKRRGERWEIRADNARRIEADAVIVAAGGSAAPVHGTSGDLFELLRGLDIEITPTAPALVALTSADSALRALKGVRVNCGIYAECKGKELYIENGEIIFSERGFSGIPILNASIRHAKNPLTAILFDLLPGDCKGDELYRLKERRTAFSTRNAGELFVGLLHKELAKLLLRRAGVPLDTSVSSLSDEVLTSLAAMSRRLRFEVSDTAGFEAAQATYGGVAPSSLDWSTLEFVAYSGLFAAGEVLDAVGDCGGYNLHWAWATGSIAGCAAARKVAQI